MARSSINIDVILDAERVPEQISWSASDTTAEAARKAKAMMLAFWDGADKTALRIDLWTKEMMVDEMADFYSSARQLMYDPAVTNAFRFAASDQVKYGNTAFGNACLTARNVLWANLGARYVQVTLGGWDNHQNIYAPNAGIYPSARQLDIGLANLIADLGVIPGSNGRTKLDETLIVVKGEFGRTVGNITSQQGRDHYFVHSALIAGGGVQGGRVLGKTTPDAAYIEDPGWSADRPVYAEDIAATIYSALGINYTTVRHDDPLGRGFEYIPSTGSYIGQPIVELFR